MGEDNVSITAKNDTQNVETNNVSETKPKDTSNNKKVSNSAEKGKNTDEQVEYSVKLYDAEDLDIISEKENSEENVSIDYGTFNPKKPSTPKQKKYPGSIQDNVSSK